MTERHLSQDRHTSRPNSLYQADRTLRSFFWEIKPGIHTIAPVRVFIQGLSGSRQIDDDQTVDFGVTAPSATYGRTPLPLDFTEPAAGAEAARRSVG
jgi:hypothetical protein